MEIHSYLDHLLGGVTKKYVNIARGLNKKLLFKSAFHKMFTYIRGLFIHIESDFLKNNM